MSHVFFTYFECLVILFSGAFVAFFPLRNWIRRSKVQIAIEVIIFCIGYSLLVFLGGTHLFNSLIVLFLIAAVMYYQRAISLPPVRSTFYLLLIANLIFLACGVSEGLYVWIFKISDTIDYVRSSTPESLLIYIFGLGLFAVSAYVLMKRAIVPLLTNEDIEGWKPLCIIALLYNLIGVWLSLPFDVSPSGYTLLCLLLLVVCAATYGLLLQTLQSNTAAIRTVTEGEMKELLVELEKKEYLRLADRLAAARRTHHDLRHQLAVLQGLARQGNLEELDGYLTKMAVALPSLSEGHYCDHPAVNALMNHHLSSYPDIDISLSLQIPPQLPAINDSDLCIVLGNLVENALEACARMSGENRFVSIRAGVQQGYFIIAVDNSFDGYLLPDKNTFFSRKRGGKEKGLGLSSVQAICEKYHGFCSFEGEGTLFKSSVALRAE